MYGATAVAGSHGAKLVRLERSVVAMQIGTADEAEVRRRRRRAVSTQPPDLINRGNAST